jgi:hypothetical protein
VDDQLHFTLALAEAAIATICTGLSSVVVKGAANEGTASAAPDFCRRPNQRKIAQM